MKRRSPLSRNRLGGDSVIAKALWLVLCVSRLEKAPFQLGEFSKVTVQRYPLTAVLNGKRCKPPILDEIPCCFRNTAYAFEYLPMVFPRTQRNDSLLIKQVVTERKCFG